VVSILAHRKFVQSPDEMDHFENAISGIRQVIPKESPLSLQLINVKLEYMVYTKYLLTPRHIYYPKPGTDTTLIICNKKDNDSMMNHVANNKKILWQNKDDNMTYTLISN